MRLEKMLVQMNPFIILQSFEAGDAVGKFRFRLRICVRKLTIIHMPNVQKSPAGRRLGAWLGMGFLLKTSQGHAGQDLHVCVYIYVYIYICMYIHICMFMYIYTYVYTYIYMFYVYMYIYVYVYICIYGYAFKDMQTYLVRLEVLRPKLETNAETV